MHKMSTEIYKGTVSHVNAGTNVHGNISTSGITGKTSGSVSSSNSYSFRVDGKPVGFSCGASVSLSDGDYVVVAGKMKKGQMEARALKNVTTSAEYNNHSSWDTISGWLCILAGIPMIVILLGIPIIIGGVYMLLVAKQGKEAIEMVHETSAA
jgi:hypothetical protein